MRQGLQLTIDLPFSVKVDGASTFRLGSATGDLRIETIKRDEVAIPGVGMLEGARLLHDDTNYVNHSRLHVRTALDGLPDEEKQRELVLLDAIPTLATGLANLVINSARLHLGDYVLRGLAGPHELHQLRIEYLNEQGEAVAHAAHTQFLSPITNQRLTYTRDQRGGFAFRIANGLEPELHQLLYLDDRMYQLKHNPRMAAANLSLAFELMLHHFLRLAGLERDHLERWTIHRLGTAGMKATFGASLEAEEFWGEPTRLSFALMKSVRDKVLHKGALTFRVGGDEINLGNEDALKRIFDAYGTVERSVFERLREKLASKQAAESAV